MSPHIAKALQAGAQMLRAGRPADAVGPLRQAAAMQPGNAAILHDLGLACLESGHVGEAIAALQAAIGVNPRYADAHLRLGIALEAAGAPEAALGAYRRATDVLPGLADARYRAGDLLASLGRMEEATLAYRRAAASAPKTLLGRIAAAKAKLAENRDDEAEKMLRQALALDRENAVALELLGNILADSGRFEEARALFLRAIGRDRLRAGCFYDVARCRRIGPQDAALIGQMRDAAAMAGLEPAQRARVHLALGKAADDLGNPEDAMRHFDAAETLRNGLVRFDPAVFEARVDRIVACFTDDFCARADTRPGSAPILIVGLPRSGTTLVEQIFSAHPAVQAGGELPFWNERGRDWQEGGGAAPDAAFLAEAASAYLLMAQSLARGARLTDKNPLNFQWAGMIHAALPQAVIVHCRRAPIDTALSIHQTHFSPRMYFPTGGEALVRYVRAYQRLMAHWRRVLPADRFVEIDYEALTAEPETVIRRMISACGLAWNDACLRPEDNARVVKTPSKWQARQAIYRSSAGRWRAYEPWLGELRGLLDGPAG